MQEERWIKPPTQSINDSRAGGPARNRTRDTNKTDSLSLNVEETSAPPSPEVGSGSVVAIHPHSLQVFEVDIYQAVHLEETSTQLKT